MGLLPKIELDDLWLVGLVIIFVGLPITVLSYLNGIGFLPSVIAGLSVGLFAGLALLSEEHLFFRVVCSLIMIALSIFLCNIFHLSMPLTAVIVGFSAILGYFAYKWVEFLSAIS